MATPATNPSAARIPIVLKIRTAQVRPGERGFRRAAMLSGTLSTGPQWGSAIDVLNGLLAPRGLALDSVSQLVGQDHLVPAAFLADLDHHDPELPVLVSHLLELRRVLDPARILAQLLPEDVLQVDQAVRLADRARHLGRVPVILRRPKQH